jgi:hypothetical protein
MIARQRWLDVRRQRRLVTRRQISWLPDTLLTILLAELRMGHDLYFDTFPATLGVNCI